MLSSPPTIRRSKSLHKQVYEALRASILGGDLRPGDRLVETQLAESLQVSRTPLREALRQLQQEGLVIADTSGGLRVTTMTRQDAIELYDCRLALEQTAVAGACHHATPEQLGSLKNLVTQAEALQQASSPPTYHQLLDLDYRFHHDIAVASGNRRLVILLDQIFDAMALLRIQTLRHNPKVLEIRLEHRQIFDAIAARQPAAAAAAICSHLVASKERVVKELEALHRQEGTIA